MPFLWRAYQFTSSLHISLFVLRKLFLIHHPQPKRPSFFIHSICCNYNNQNELILFLLPFQDNQSATHLPLSSSSIMKTLFQILILLATTVALVSSQGTKIKDFPLSVASSVSCDTIVTQSSFGGDCCALNRTDGGGCVLNVINGYCKVSSLVTIELCLDAIYTCHRTTILHSTLRCNDQTRPPPQG
jgi:hypothetical protein